MTSRVPHHGRSRFHILRDHSPRAYQCVRPDRQAAADHRPGADARAALDTGLEKLPVGVRLRQPLARRRTRVLVVDEEHSVSDEYLVRNRHAGADERVTLDLAVSADLHSALDLDERANASPVSDLAAVEIRERLDDHVLAERDIFDHAIRRVVYRPVSHPDRPR